jgi:hypothetical protein
LLEIRRGKAVRFVAYWDRNRVVADLGIAPEGKAADRPE